MCRSILILSPLCGRTSRDEASKATRNPDASEEKYSHSRIDIREEDLSRVVILK